ncbi:MAG: peptidoglycan editing factor PgeF [Panacagrimonas sp.]
MRLDVKTPTLIHPDWPRHPRVAACFTTRVGGHSLGPYAGFNLAHHVGDDPSAVAANRHDLRVALQLEHEPAWLDQVHGTEVVQLTSHSAPICADASWTGAPGHACVVMSADCLPVLFADDSGRYVAAAHAGWRGLLAGVLEATIARLPVAPTALSVWMGPAIGRHAFEVGEEVRAAFCAEDAAAAAAFGRSEGGRYLADLYALARMRLTRCGVTRVHGGDRCTVSEPELFFSYRRQGRCGRMGALIWLTS